MVCCYLGLLLIALHFVSRVIINWRNFLPWFTSGHLVISAHLLHPASIFLLTLQAVGTCMDLFGSRGSFGSWSGCPHLLFSCSGWGMVPESPDWPLLWKPSKERCTWCSPAVWACNPECRLEHISLMHSMALGSSLQVILLYRPTPITSYSC